MLTPMFLQRLGMAGTRCLTAKFLSQGHTPINIGYSMLLTQLSAKNETVYQHFADTVISKMLIGCLQDRAYVASTDERSTQMMGNAWYM